MKKRKPLSAEKRELILALVKKGAMVVYSEPPEIEKK